MGDHYIPQYYLKGFCEPTTPGVISRYEKGSPKIVTTGLKNIAQETGFYSPEVERFLADKIETPANSALDKLRNRQLITPEERFALAGYMITLLKRVPESQSRVQKALPEVAESVFGQIDEELARIVEANPAKAELVARRREEARQIRAQYEEGFPKDIWLRLISPTTAPRALAILNAMTWRFLTFGKESAFLTSDNPVYFHQGIGIGHQESEVTFPISRNVVLWATWKDNVVEDFYETSKRAAREINRRTVSIATRYVFFSREERWVINIVNRKKLTLNRMR